MRKSNPWAEQQPSGFRHGDGSRLWVWHQRKNTKLHIFRRNEEFWML